MTIQVTDLINNINCYPDAPIRSFYERKVWISSINPLDYDKVCNNFVKQKQANQKFIKDFNLDNQDLLLNGLRQIHEEFSYQGLPIPELFAVEEVVGYQGSMYEFRFEFDTKDPWLMKQTDNHELKLDVSLRISISTHANIFPGSIHVFWDGKFNKFGHFHSIDSLSQRISTYIADDLELQKLFSLQSPVLSSYPEY